MKTIAPKNHRFAIERGGFGARGELGLIGKGKSDGFCIDAVYKGAAHPRINGKFKDFEVFSIAIVVAEITDESVVV